MLAIYEGVSNTELLMRVRGVQLCTHPALDCLQQRLPQIPFPDVASNGHGYMDPRYTITETKQNSVALVRKRTIPTERPPLVGEVSANLCGSRVLRGQRNEFPLPLFSVF
jgi:hypothetical protein